MTKQILILMLLMLTFSNIYAQNVLVPKIDLLALIQNNEKGKKARALVPVYEKKITILEETNKDLTNIVKSKDSTIADQKVQIFNFVQIVRNDSIMQKNNEYIVKDLQSSLKQQTRATKRANRKTKLVGGTGLATVLYLGFKLITK